MPNLTAPDLAALEEPIITPEPDKNGLPLCSQEDCPQYDGKRCRLMGFRPDRFCEPMLLRQQEASDRVYMDFVRVCDKATRLESEREGLVRLLNRALPHVDAAARNIADWSEDESLAHVLAAEIRAALGDK